MSATPPPFLGLGPLVDTHAHLDSPRLAANLPAVLQRAAHAGVTHAVMPGVHPQDFAGLWRWSQRPAPLRLHAAFGIHPRTLVDEPPSWDEAAAQQVAQALECYPAVAVGECGLDARLDLARAPWERQVALLRAHLHLALKHQLPLLLHCVGAHERLLRCLQEYSPFPFGGVLHGCSANAQQLPGFLKLGLHVAFGGAVTWPRARKAVLAARAVPNHLLLCETDSPDQSPQGHRGEPNEPAHLGLVVTALATARGEDPQVTAALCTRNAKNMFHFL